MGLATQNFGWQIIKDKNNIIRKIKGVGVLNYKIPIIPYNEFWLDCDTETLYSIIYSMNQKYKVHFYENNYTYDLLRVPSPSGEFFGEIRLQQQFIELREKVLDIVEKRRFNNVTNAIDTIKNGLRTDIWFKQALICIIGLREIVVITNIM